MFKNIANLFRYIPKRFVPILAGIAVLAIPAIVLAWGPSRATFTMAHPADYVTFNSITDNPEFGDERNFLAVKADDGTWKNDLNVEPGKEYMVRMTVHNNADPKMNQDGSGIAKNARVKVSLPATTGTSVPMSGFVSADNATPKEVWADVQFKANSKFNVAFVGGSAKYYNQQHKDGANLPDSIMTSTGALIGNDQMDGNMGACFDKSGYVIFKVKVQGPQTPDFKIEKSVRNNATGGAFNQNVTAKAGDKVDYQIHFTNTGQTQLNNVLIRDQLPAGMTYVAGSTKLVNGNHPSGVAMPDGITAQGLNINAYAAGAGAYLKFTAQLPAETALQCGENKFHNVASAQPDQQAPKEDDADVTVPKECQETPPCYECTGLTMAQKSRTQFSFTANSKIENATLVGYRFTVRDKNNNVVTTQDVGTDGKFDYQTSTIGNYTVSAQVIAKVGNETKVSPDSDKCRKPFEVKPENTPAIAECVKLTASLKSGSRNTYAFATTTKAEGNVQVKQYTYNFGDGSQPLVTTKDQVDYAYQKDGDWKATVTVQFIVDGKVVTKSSQDCQAAAPVQPDECKPGVPTGSEDCTPPAEKCDVAGKEDLPKNSPDCIPAELPATGMAGAVGGLVGISAIGMSARAYIESRRNLPRR